MSSTTKKTARQVSMRQSDTRRPAQKAPAAVPQCSGKRRRQPASPPMHDLADYATMVWRLLNKSGYAELSYRGQGELAEEVCAHIRGWIMEVAERAGTHSTYATKKSAITTFRHITKAILLAGQMLGLRVRQEIGRDRLLVDEWVRILESMTPDERIRVGRHADHTGETYWQKVCFVGHLARKYHAEGFYGLDQVLKLLGADPSLDDANRRRTLSPDMTAKQQRPSCSHCQCSTVLRDQMPVDDRPGRTPDTAIVIEDEPTVVKIEEQPAPSSVATEQPVPLLFMPQMPLHGFPTELVEQHPVFLTDSTVAPPMGYGYYPLPPPGDQFFPFLTSPTMPTFYYEQPPEAGVMLPFDASMAAGDHLNPSIMFSAGSLPPLPFHNDQDQFTIPYEHYPTPPTMVLEDREPSLVAPAMFEDCSYEVERIRASRLVRGVLRYQADWKDYDCDDWFPAADFKGAPHLLHQFHERFPDAAGPPKRLDIWLQAYEDGLDDPGDHREDNKPVDAPDTRKRRRMR